jgi:putative membrane protein
MNLIQRIVVALKGFFMGAANVVPGVSGGTIALITGIYKEIIDALGSLTSKETWKALFRGDFKGFWKEVHGTFLVWLAIGVVTSVLTLSKLMDYVLDNYPVQTWAFFFGLIVASAIIMFKGIRGWGVKEVLFVLFGVGLGLLLGHLTPTETPNTWPVFFLCGAIAVCTMILPGVSGSFVLVLLGKYDEIMEALAELDWPVLIVFGLGCVVGILLFSHFLRWLLARFEKQTMLVLLGFVVGSLVKIWPWSNPEVQVLPDPQYGAAAIWGVLGVVVVLGAEAIAARTSKQQQ